MPGRRTKPDVLRWVEDYAVLASEPSELDRLTREINDQIRAAIPEIRADEGLFADLVASTRESLRTYLPVIAAGLADDVAVPGAALDLARAFAHRRLELTSLLKLYRAGFDVVWRQMMEAVAADVADPQLRFEVLGYLWPHVNLRINASVDAVVAAYTDERERMLRGALARRSETIHAILRGEGPPADEAERVLGHPVRRNQTALVLWEEDGAVEGGGLGRLEGCASRLASDMGAARALTLPAGAHGLWAWIATDRTPAFDGVSLEPDGGIRAAAGGTALGLAGFRSSHREALLAQRVAMAGRHGRLLTVYADVELVSLVSGDRDVMRALVARELGGLAGQDGATRRLRETARAFLAAGGNARIAGQSLSTHKNTVIYRLTRIEELLGHPIAERRMQLELALMLVDAFGDELLAPVE
jgi:hypothetical protein